MDSATATTDAAATLGRERRPSSRRVAANRLNALQSTGPRSAAGKRRAALNGVTRGLISEAFEATLRARGENPCEFRRLHRDLIAIFRPRHEVSALAVERLAEMWWEKARRGREWVGGGRPVFDDLDFGLEKMLVLVVQTEQERHERWRMRLASVLGFPIKSPSDIRRRIERRLHLLGGGSSSRRYPPPPHRPYTPGELEEAIKKILAERRQWARETRATERPPATRLPPGNLRAMIQLVYGENGETDQDNSKFINGLDDYYSPLCGRQAKPTNPK